MTDTIQLPDLDEGKKIALFFSGGINSTLLAYLAKQKYGAENIIPFFNGFGPIRDIMAGNKTNSEIQKIQTLLANRKSSFYKMYEILELQNRIVLDSIEKYNFGTTNLVRDSHRVNYITALLNIFEENFGVDSSIIQGFMLGHEKLDMEIRALNELDAQDGVIFNIDINEVTKHIEDHKSDYPEAIKHDVTKRWNEWSRSNSFYKLDNDQIIPVNGVQGYGPLQTISKTRIVQMYREMGLDELLAQTTSCHIGPQYPVPCSFCISCFERSVALDVSSIP